MATLFELKEALATLDAAVAGDGEWLATKAADPTTPQEEIDKKLAHQKDMIQRRDIIKAEHDRMEAAQKAHVQQAASMTKEDELIAKKAAFYRAALLGGDVRKAYEGLGGIPAANADLGYGDKLLPKNTSRDLVMEPVEDNPLRTVCRVTNITGYEEPKLGYTIEDADLADVTDKQTANELALEGDSIAYGRQKVKVFATIKDTVLHGTDTDLVAAVESILRSAIAKREKRYAFQTAASISSASDTAHAHMSFYNAPSGTSAIKEVEGDTLYEAIAAALGDLADEFAERAVIVMSRADYYGMIKDLANNSEALFSDKPASILGRKVVFCDKAVVPVVGDFAYYGINYDIGAVYETDKDAVKGEYYFVLTAWGDQQIRLKSAFRLAVVAAANP